MDTKLPGMLGLVLSALLSNTAFGLAALCSEDASAERGATTEQVIWNYYDYWYSGIYVGGDRLEERLPADSDYTSMNPVAPGAETDLMTGYPAPWGMESFVRIDCPPTEEQTDELLTDTEDDTGDDDASPDDTGAPIAMVCNAGPDSSCEPLAASGDAAAPEQSTRAAATRTPSFVTVGTIQKATDGTLTVRTDTGRYFIMNLPSGARVERHTAVDLTALMTGDIIGAVVGGTVRANREALLVRVYRNVEGATARISSSTSDAAAVPGLELRGILRSVGSGTESRTLRLAYTTRESTLQVAADVPVIIVETADASALKPFLTRVRVFASREGDSLVVRSIDILL